jgi:hypothetical protein
MLSSVAPSLIEFDCVRACVAVFAADKLPAFVKERMSTWDKLVDKKKKEPGEERRADVLCAGDLIRNHYSHAFMHF